MRRASPHILLTLAAFLWLLASVSCSDRSAMRQLQAVEAILDDAPADARARLDSIDASTLQGESRALYAMLKTQADYKCYVDITSDSLIREATTYYGTSRKSWRAAMSWYSLGCVSDLCGNDTTAIDAYLKALSLFPDTLVRQYVLCEHNLGSDYLYHHFNDKALSVFGNCKAGAMRLLDTTTAVYCDYHIATALLYQKRYQQSDSIFKSLLRSGNLPESLNATIYRELAKIQHYGYGDDETAMQYIDEALKRGSTKKSAGAKYCIKADIFYSYNKPDSAYAYYVKSLLDDGGNLQTKCNTYSKLSELAAMLGKTEESADYLKKYNVTLAQVYEEYHQNAINEIQSRHQNELQKLRLASVRRHTLIVSVLFLSLLITASILLYRRKVRLIKDAYSQEYSEALRQLRVTKTEELGNRLQADARSYKNTNAYILMKEITEARREATASETAIIEQALSEAFQDIIAEMRLKAPHLNTDEIYYCLLSYIGLNSVQCGYFLHNYSNLRMMKKRVKCKMPYELSLSIFIASANSSI